MKKLSVPYILYDNAGKERFYCFTCRDGVKRYSYCDDGAAVPKRKGRIRTDFNKLNDKEWDELMYKCNLNSFGNLKQQIEYYRALLTESGEW